MKKMVGAVVFSVVLAVSVGVMGLINDSQALEEKLIRLHVVAASDSEEDQALKLQVRDAVLESIRQDLREAGDVEAAKAYLQENLPKIEASARECLQKLGCSEEVFVGLTKEKFDRRDYEGFSLPAGIYESLRVVIGEGQGHNWWCVAYPELCLAASSGAVETAAEQAGLSKSLRGAMVGDYELRFFLLDLLGRLKTRGKVSFS